MRRLGFITMLFFTISVAIGQQSLFKDGDRISFVGSSIAMKGSNFHYINLFYATRYPGQKITFLNGGIGGDITDGIIARMQEDVLSKNPTWVVMMLEENDLQPGLYYKSRQEEAGIAEKKQHWLENWFKNADSIIRILKNANVKIILETPTIYDQTGDLPAENGYGVNDALQKCAAHLKQLSEKYNLPLVDCWTILKEVNEVVQKKDATKSIIGQDRVHVSPMGYFVMAYQFLKSIPVNKTVSTIVVDAAKNTLLQQTNCTVSGLEATASRLSFSQTGNSLPFPSPDGITVDSFFSFSSEMNAEILRVKKLKPGNYNILIDQITIGKFSNKDLEEGINLSLFKNTPQYVQAAGVLPLFEAHWKLEYSLRMIQSIESNYLRNLEDKENMADIQKAFDEILEKYKQKRGYNYLKNIFSDYLANKPKEKDMISRSDLLLQSIHQSCVPRQHKYEIARLSD